MLGSWLFTHRRRTYKWAASSHPHRHDLDELKGGGRRGCDRHRRWSETGWMVVSGRRRVYGIPLAPGVVPAGRGRQVQRRR